MKGSAAEPRRTYRKVCSTRVVAEACMNMNLRVSTRLQRGTGGRYKLASRGAVEADGGGDAASVTFHLNTRVSSLTYRRYAHPRWTIDSKHALDEAERAVAWNIDTILRMWRCNAGSTRLVHRRANSRIEPKTPRYPLFLVRPARLEPATSYVGDKRTIH